MTERTIQSILVTTGLTEAELADLLEGGSIGQQREAALRATLAQNPDIAHFFSGVRADRSALRTLDQAVRAPSGLLESVEMRLEQEALSSLTEPSGPIQIPVAPPALRIERESPLLAVLRGAWTRRLATAAGLALAITAGLWGTYVGIQNWPRGGGTSGPKDLGPIVRNDKPPVLPEGTGVEGTGDTLIATAEPATSMFTVLAPSSPADGPGVAADGSVFDERELLQLAGEGRLAIVISGDSRSIPDRIGRLAASGPEFGASSLDEAAAAGAMPSVSDALSREAEIPRTDWATSLHDPWSGWSTAAAPSRRFINLTASTDPASLRSALAACGLLGEGSHLPGRTVRVLVLDQPVSQTPELDAASVLWWSASPSKWSRQTTVPVIIEE